MGTVKRWLKYNVWHWLIVITWWLDDLRLWILDKLRGE